MPKRSKLVVAKLEDRVMDEVYTPSFFTDFRDLSHSSANNVVPLIIEWIKPASVIDIGCGTASWLSVFREHGVVDLMGVDGEYISNEILEIDEANFIAHDLTVGYKASRKFDFAMSLEVGEHLPEKSASLLVTSLVDLAPVVLFSAAIPHQNGTQHVNCQWPAYWAELFAMHGYVAIDILRPRLWGNPNVAWWYQQNILIYIAQDLLPNYPSLIEFKRLSPSIPPSFVHPTCLEEWVVWGREQSLLYWEAMGEKGK
jgi:methyltransferase family protein